jgi:hypothetical protein
LAFNHADTVQQVAVLEIGDLHDQAFFGPPVLVTVLLEVRLEVGIRFGLLFLREVQVV